MERDTITPAIIRVLQLSLSIASVIAYHDHLAKLRDQVLYLQLTLKRVRDLLEETDDKPIQNSGIVLERIRESESKLGEFDEALQTEKAAQPTVGHKLRPLLSPLKNTDVDLVIEDFHHCTENISSCFEFDARWISLTLEQAIVLDRLSSAQGASPTSGTEHEDPICLPNTQNELLQHLRTWVDDPGSTPVMSLEGAPGAGKSTIVRTFAKMLIDENFICVRFFTKNGEGDQEDFRKVILTVAAELALSQPATAWRMKHALDVDPSLTTMDQPEKFYQLVMEPLLESQVKSFKKTVFLFDGYRWGELSRDFAMFNTLTIRPSSLNGNIKALFTATPVTLEYIRLKPYVHPSLFTFHRTLNLYKQPKATFQRAIAVLVRLKVQKFVDEYNMPLKVQKFVDEYNTSAPSGLQVSSEWLEEILLQFLTNFLGPSLFPALAISRFAFDCIKSGADESQLRQVLAGKPATLATIYGLILDRPMNGLSIDQQAMVIADFQDVVGAIVTLKDPLSVPSLSRILDISRERIGLVLGVLGSLCSVPEAESSPVWIVDCSFREYLLRPRYHQRGWHKIDSKRAHAKLTRGCFRLMSKSLRYNVCDLRANETTRLMISSRRINDRLTPAVRYACLYWGFHVTESTDSMLHDEIFSFLKIHLFHWIEAVSLLGEVSRAVHMIQSLRIWENNILPYFTTRSAQSLASDATNILVANQSILGREPLQAYSYPQSFSPFRRLYRRIRSGELSNYLSSSIELGNSQACLRKIKSYLGPVNSATFSHDSTLVVSTSHDATCQIWHVKTGKVQDIIPGLAQGTSFAKLSHDSAFIALNFRGDTLLLWDVEENKSEAYLIGHKSWVNSAVFSHDSTYIASASADQTVRLWSRTTHQCLRVLQGHQHWVNSVSFSHDSTLIASGSSDGTIRVWSTSTGHCVEMFELGSIVNSVMFSHDSQLLVSTSEDPFVRIWQRETGKCIRELRGRGSWITSAIFSHDSALIASGSDDGTVRLWRVDTGECVQTLKGHNDAVASVAFSHDSSLVASASDDTTIKIWAVEYNGTSSREADNEKQSQPADIDAQSQISDSGSLSSIASFGSDGADYSKARRGSLDGVQDAARVMTDCLSSDAAIYEPCMSLLQKLGATEFSQRYDEVFQTFMWDVQRLAKDADLELAARLLNRRESRTLITKYLINLLQAERNTLQERSRHTSRNLGRDANSIGNSIVLSQQPRSIPATEEASQPFFPDLGVIANAVKEIEAEVETDDEEGDNLVIPSTLFDRIESLVESMTAGIPFRTFKSNLSAMITPPTTLSTVLSTGDITALRALLREHFDSVAQGEYSWLREVEELGHTRDEIADLLLEDATDSPWIYFTPAPEPEPSTAVQLEHHVPGCVHQLPWLQRSLETHVNESSVPIGDISGVLQEVQRLCGFAGVTPSSRELEEWKGSVVFAEDNTVAAVSYEHPDTNRILSRVTDCLELLCSAVSHAQLAGLCCESLTILRHAITTSSEEDPNERLIEVCRIKVSILDEMLIELKRSGKGRDIRTVDSSVALELLTGLFPEIRWQRTQDSSHIPAYLHLNSLSTQLLSLGFLSYLQAHVGPLHPFFLDTAIERGALVGCHTAPEDAVSIKFEMRDLTCMSEMLQGRVMVFSAHPAAVDLEKPLQPAREQKFDLLVSAEDLIDTWGPGQFIVPASNPGLPSAVRIGGGIVARCHAGSDQLHWSRNPSAEQFCNGQLDPLVKVRIGSLVTVNSNCALDEEQCRARYVGFLRPLGTYAPGFELTERQMAFQAGQYVVFQANAGYHRYPGRTLKQLRLEQGDEELPSFLEENWAVQVSLCTGIARRVPLRVMVADVLPVFANKLTAIDDCAKWERLSGDHHILEAFRGHDLQIWLRTLEQPLHDFVIRMTRRILDLLSQTGLDRKEKSFIISWPHAGNTYQGFYIDLRQKESSWAHLIADSEDCATFAYVSPTCLETTDVRCRGIHGSWRNAVPLLETAVLAWRTAEADSGDLVRQLNHRDTCFFQKLGNMHFVRVDKPDTARFAKLVQMSNSIPPRFRKRLFSGAQLRLRERNGIQEGGEKVALLTLQV